MRLVLLGPPGAGKGTQAVMLSERFQLLHISTGDILRENVKNRTDIGKLGSSFMEKGELVPDDIVISMMIEKIKTIQLSKGFILDGFPRTIYQAKKLDPQLDRLNLSIDMVIYFRTSIDTVILRLTGRRLCKKCGANYHIVNMPPKKQGICDICNGELYQRKDDNEGTIKKRLEVFNSQTKDLVGYYKVQNKLVEISGDVEADKVNENILGIFKSKKYCDNIQ